MNDAEKVLVIFLSVALAIFLILAITLLVKVLQLLKKVRLIADKFEALADKAQNVAEVIEKTATPMAIGRLIAKYGGSIFGKVRGKRSKS